MELHAFEAEGAVQGELLFVGEDLADIAAEGVAALAAARASQPVVRQYQPLLTAAAQLPQRLTAAAARGEVSSFQLAQARQQRTALEADFHAAAARYLTLLAEAETAAGLVPTPI
jgi:hypothetical protein